MADYDAAKAETVNKQEQLKNAEQKLQPLVDGANGKTNGTVTGLADAQTAQEALDALEQAYQTGTEELNELNDALTQALETAEQKQTVADQKADAAQNSGTGITADGDVKLEMNDSSGTGSLGTQDNALGITAGGSVSVTTGEGTTLVDVNIESGGDLTVDSLEASGEVNLTAKGDIKGSPDSETVDITAPSANIGSLNGDVGSEDNPLRTMLDEVNAYGENVYLENL